MKELFWRTAAATMALAVLGGQAALPASAEVGQPLIQDECAFANPTQETSLVNAWQIDRLGLRDVWRLSTGKGIKVAVIDTGVSTLGSPYLDTTVTGQDGATRKRITAIDLMGGPREDDTNGMECSHGTMVTSLLAAGLDSTEHPLHPGTDFAGVAPEVEVIAYRTLTLLREGDDDNRDPDPLAPTVAAVRAATAAGVDIINLSQVVSDDPSLDDYRSAIAEAIDAGIVVVAAAGNANQFSGAALYPAAFPGVIAVGASDQGDAGAPESALVGRNVTIGAPGKDVLGLAPSTPAASATVANQSYAVRTGTSFATPLVSGVVALLLEYEQRMHGVELTPAQVKQRLVDTADPPGNQAPDLRIGAGIVNPMRALMNTTSAPLAAQTPVPPKAAVAERVPTLGERALPFVGLGVGVGAVLLVTLGLVAAIAIPRAVRRSG